MPLHELGEPLRDQLVAGGVWVKIRFRDAQRRLLAAFPQVEKVENQEAGGGCVLHDAYSHGAVPVFTVSSATNTGTAPC